MTTKKDHATTKNITTKSSNKIEDLLLLLARAKAFLHLNRTEEAIKEATRIAQKNPNNMEALQIRARANYLNTNFEHAMLDCQAALVIDPQSRFADEMLRRVRQIKDLFEEADTYNERKQHKQAAQHFRRIIHIVGSKVKCSALYRKSHYGRAHAALKDGNYTQAVASANLVLESHPNDVETWHIKIRSSEQLGQLQSLSKELQHIIQTWGSDNLVIMEAYQRIQKMNFSTTAAITTSPATQE